MKNLNGQLEKFEQEMHNNVENMICEFGLDKIHVVSAQKQYSYSNPDKSDKCFYGISLYPVHLFDVIQHIETIIDEDDCDTISGIIDLFTFAITPNMLLTRTNTSIMNEVAAMLDAYNSSLVKFIYESKDVSEQSLVYDYDKDVYTYTLKNVVTMTANDEFMHIEEGKEPSHQYTSFGGTVECRWYKNEVTTKVSGADDTKEYQTTDVPVSDMIDVIAHNKQFEKDADLLETMYSMIEWLSEFNDFYKARWDEDAHDFIVTNPNGEEKSYLGFSI